MIPEQRQVVVAIDPGHPSQKGKPGCIADKGRFVEADYTMFMGRRLNRALQREPGFAPVLLRQNDGEVISVPDRASHASDAKADFVVSIHVDSCKDEKRRGATILYWPGNVFAASIADCIASSMPHMLRRDIFGTPALEETYPSARNVIRCYNQPTVLVECGMASNRNNLKALKRDTVQAMIIGAMVQGMRLLRHELVEEKRR
jgi:N-acetylmuramoyl-L-alanine amidase